MKIAIACGGTGGHTFPGIAVAGKLEGMGHEVSLWLAGKRVEGATVSMWKGPVVTINSAGLPSGFSMKGVWRLLLLAGAVLKAIFAVQRLRPDVLLGMGSYASVGPAIACMIMRVPVVLHEANVVPGRANRLLARRAACVAIGFRETAARLKNVSTVYTGMPLLMNRAGDSERPDLGNLEDNVFTVLVMGGSGGARVLSAMACDALCALVDSGKEVQVIHLAGNYDEGAIRKKYAAHGVSACVFGFLKDMDSAYRRCDLAVCRSGASTCAELALYGLPALLVPFPHAIHGHQLANAEAMAASGGVDVIKESEMSIERLCAYVAGKMDDLPVLTKMRTVLQSGVEGDSAEALARVVLRAAEGDVFE